jgi:hypothetical protein
MVFLAIIISFVYKQPNKVQHGQHEAYGHTYKKRYHKPLSLNRDGSLRLISLTLLISLSISFSSLFAYASEPAARVL